MEDSQPLRRSTRNSVVLKNEELTPRKKKVSTPVKVEPSTPSRRTRASSATPKKNLIEVLNTPKKPLPVLNEEENPANNTRTPVKKGKEISPKTPSRRRTVRESVSTPSRVSVDRSAKKPVDASEELNVTASRPLTRAKRKTMGEIQAAEVITTSTESEKAVANKKDKSVVKSVSINDKTNKSPESKSDKKLDESCFALVPRVVIADIAKDKTKKEEKPENIVEGNDCGMFTSKSPVRAEDIAINSPRKVPENCKSISESSLMSDLESINVKSQKVIEDAPNPITSIQNNDVNSDPTTCLSPVSTKLDSTSPEKNSDSKDNDIPNIIVTSPHKDVGLRDNSIPNIVVTSPSPKKIMDKKDDSISNIVTASPKRVAQSEENNKNDSDYSFGSEQKISPRKSEVSSPDCNVKEDNHESSKSETPASVNAGNETVSTPDEKKVINLEEKSSPVEEKSINFSPEKKIEVTEMKINEKSSIDYGSPSKTPSPKKVDSENSFTANIIEKNSVEAIMQVSSIDTLNHTDIDLKMSQIENDDSKEFKKSFEEVKSIENVLDSAEASIAKESPVKESAESDSKDENDVSKIVTDMNEENREDVNSIKDEKVEVKIESKLDNSANKTFNLDTSFLNESCVPNSSEEVDVVCENVPPGTELIMEAVITEGGNEKNGKFSPEKASPSSALENVSSSPKKIHSCGELLKEDNNKNGNSVEVSMIQNNCEKSEEPIIEISKESSPVKPNNSPIKPSDPPEIKSGLGSSKETDDDEDSKPWDNKNNLDSPSNAVFFIQYGSETSDDSGDSGIQNDESVVILSSQYEKLITREENLSTNITEHSENKVVKDVLKSDQSDTKNIESKSRENLEGENKKVVSESGTPVIESSDRKSDLNSSSVDKNCNTPSDVEDKTEKAPENSEPTDDCTDNKVTGLDAILMSPNDFLNSDEEVEKAEDAKTKDSKETCKENQPLEEVENTNQLEPSISGTQESISSNLNISINSGFEDSSIKVDENQCDDISNNKTEIISNGCEIHDEVKDTCIDQEKYEISQQNEENNENKSSSGSSEVNNICENKSEAIITDDVLEKTKSPKHDNSIVESETEVSKTERNIKDDLNGSLSVSANEGDEKSLKDSELSKKPIETEFESEANSKDSDSSEGSEIDGEQIKNRSKKLKKKIEPETDGSQSDNDSELSSNPPSNEATEGSSDVPLCGKDFIDFEAEEGEETSEDDSFVVSSRESSSSRTSEDTQSYKMKLRKRKRNLDSESSESYNYVDSVQRLFDNSVDHTNDDSQEDTSIKKKRLKLEKVTSASKKSLKPKSISRNKYTAVESMRNKNKTENKVIKEPSKTGIFIVSSINQVSEESKSSRYSSKRSSKLNLEQKKLEFSDYDGVPMGFSIDDAKVGNDAALRGFVVSYDESYLISKKPRKAVIGSSALMSKKKKMNEVKNVKKTRRSSESKWEGKHETNCQYVVSLILPFSMTCRSVTNVLTDLGLGDISSVNFPRPKVAIIEFSSKEPFKKILKLYGELKINDKPIYVLEGCSLV